MNKPKVAPEASIVCDIWDKAPLGPAPLVITLNVPKMKPYATVQMRARCTEVSFLDHCPSTHFLCPGEYDPLTIDMPTRLPVIAPIFSFWNVDISSAPCTSGGGAGILQDGLWRSFEFHTSVVGARARSGR